MTCGRRPVATSMLCAVALAVTLGGCSSGAAPGHRTSTSAAGIAADNPDAAAIAKSVDEAWILQRDAKSGFTFRAPGTMTQRDRTDDGIVQRVYTYAYSEQAAVSVAVVDLPSAARVRPFVDDYAADLRTQFASNGVNDFAVSGTHRSDYRGRPALDMQFTYTPLTAPTVSPCWLIRLVTAGKRVVVLQTVASAVPAATCRPAQQKLVAGLRF